MKYTSYLLIVLVSIIGVTGGYYFYRAWTTKSPADQTTNTVNNSTTNSTSGFSEMSLPKITEGFLNLLPGVSNQTTTPAIQGNVANKAECEKIKGVYNATEDSCKVLNGNQLYRNGLFVWPGSTVKTANLLLSDSGKHLTFDYISDTSYPAKPHIVGNQVFLDAGSDGALGLGMVFWPLNGQAPRIILQSIVNDLPDAYQRQHCIITSSTVNGKPAFSIDPDDEYQNKSDDSGLAINSPCGEYGAVNAIRYFTQVGDYLFLFNLGQDAPRFSAGSVKVV